MASDSGEMSVKMTLIAIGVMIFLFGIDPLITIVECYIYEACWNEFNK